MSSDLLTLQRSTNYCNLAIIVAVSYDYCITFPNEVTYIWRRPWTWVSTLFLLIRYGGYLSVISTALCNAVYLLGNWAYPLFWVGADMVMILRVYAMYSRSKTILGILLVMYITEVAFLFVSSSIYSDPNYAIVSITPFFDLLLCNIGFSTQTWNNASTITQFILGTVMCVLVVAQFARQSLQAYRATRKWQLNSYMHLLLREGILYFIVYVYVVSLALGLFLLTFHLGDVTYYVLFSTLFYSLVNMLGLLGLIPFGWVTMVFFVAINIPLYTLTPRFVMNIRELYAREREGRRDRDIDSGFGLSSTVRGVGVSATIGTIAFAQGPVESKNEETVMVEEGMVGGAE